MKSKLIILLLSLFCLNTMAQIQHHYEHKNKTESKKTETTSSSKKKETKTSTSAKKKSTAAPTSGTENNVYIKGIYYNVDFSTKKATVTYLYDDYKKNKNAYSGNVVIPETVTYKNAVFKVTSIGDKAFYYCDGVTSVTIPNSVKSIGEWTFAYCEGLKSITIPNSVTSIGKGAFWGCFSLTSVTIPNSMTTIGNSAFSFCKKLKEVTCRAVKVPSTHNIYFDKVNQSSATLYVPASSLEAYKSAAPWKDFGTIKAIKE